MSMMTLYKLYCSTSCCKRHRSELKYSGTEGVDFITCPLCKYRTRQFTPAHAKMHGYPSIQEFAQSVGLNSVTCDKKKLSQSGENNNAYGHGGKLSPWSKKFVRGYDADKHKAMIENSKKRLAESKEKYKFLFEYWLTEAKGDVDIATALYKNFQTRNLSWFIDKYGEEEGKKRHSMKTEKWVSTMNNKPEEEKLRINKAKAVGISSTSKPEYELYESLAKHLADVEHQFSMKRDEIRRYNYDIRYNNKIIEFNGDFWHCNPDQFDENFFNKRTKRTARETWEKDEAKIQFAICSGYEVLVIWENKYLANKEQVIQECLNFLTS